MTRQRFTVAAISLVTLIAPGTAFATEADWRVSEMSGAVATGPASGIRPVARGSLVHAGDLVSTGAGARAVLTRGEEFVIVSASSRLRLPDAAAAGGITQWMEDLGTAVFHIRKMMTPHFGVRTPYLAAVVKGTTFSVTVGRDGASVQVVEGAVEVSTSDGRASEIIRPGAIATVTATNRFRLTIDGDTRRVIDSPGSPKPTQADPPTDDAGAIQSPEITTVIEDERPPLDMLTGGLVRADTAALAMASAARQQTAIASAPRETGAQPATVTYVAPVSDPPAAPPAAVTPAPVPVDVAMVPPTPMPAPPVAVAVVTPVPNVPVPAVSTVVTGPAASTQPTAPSLLTTILAALNDARNHGHGNANGHNRGNQGETED